jgi:hypothetical protein
MTEHGNAAATLGLLEQLEAVVLQLDTAAIQVAPEHRRWITAESD